MQGNLSNWRVGEVLGAGAGGPVHAVQHRHDGRPGALKRARPGDDDAATRMRAEIAVLTRIQHPNLVALLDAGEAEGAPWLVLERMEESAAVRLLLADTLPADEIVALGAQVLDALTTLHAAGIVHRDVKPANLLRSDDGAWKLADLGSVRTAASALTQTGSALGTPAFMAPEQRHGARHVGPSADLYALGATLWCLSRGELPFELHADDEASWKGLPPGLAEVVRVATRLQPEARWNSAQAMRDALIRGAGDPATPLPDVQAPAHAPAGGARGSNLRRVRAAAGTMILGGLLLAWFEATPFVNAPTATGATPHLTLRMTGGPQARLGTSLRSGADVAGTLEEDIAIGSPGDHVGGAVILFLDGCCDAENDALTTRIPDLAYGTSVALVPRVDKDSRGGIVIGGPSASGRVDDGPAASGQVFLKDDLASRVGTTLQDTLAQPFGEAGTAVEAWLGQDGRSFVAYGAPGANRSGVPHAGQVVVIDGDEHVRTVLYGEAPGDRLGGALTRADLDNDGDLDIVAGAPGARGGAGCVWVLPLGPSSGTADASAGSTAYLLACGEPGEAYGSALANAGDLDGDGRDEVWIGAPGGEGRVLRVDATGVRAEVRATLPGAGFGSVLHARADLPGGLWVGAPDDREGRVWAFSTMGDGGHDVGEADLVLRGAQVGGRFGAALAVHRDRGGVATLLVGAPGELEGAGRVWGGG